MPFFFVKNFVDKNWKKFGDVGFVSYRQGEYILKFSDEVTKLDVLENGPWFIGG